MKRITTIALFATLALLAAVSCRKENEQAVEWRTELQAVKSNLVFFPAGGTGTLEMNLSSLSVTSDKAWCSASASGNIITVTVPANEDKQSRYAKLTITSGSESINAAVIQYGEVFDGLEIVDMKVPAGGIIAEYPYISNLDIQLSADQDWVHFSIDEEESVVTVTVDQNQNYGTRSATISYSAGSNSKSARVKQEGHAAFSDAWDFAVTDGVFDFPNQIDYVTATPASSVSDVKYFFTVVGKDSFTGVVDTYILSEVLPAVRSSIQGLVDNGTYASFGDALATGEKTVRCQNLSSSVYGIIIGFDDEGDATGHYSYKELAVPDRGPVKQLVEGWDAVRTGGSYAYPNQTDVFTVTPKAGYENVKYIATAVSKASTSDVEDFAFTTFAMSEREAILAKVASGAYASFDEGLHTGETTISVNGLSGDVYVVVVAFSDNKFYTGDYSVIELSVPDEKRAYWLGTWTMTNTAGQSYTWTIEDKGDDSGNFVMFCNGLYTGSGATLKSFNWMDLIYNEDGSVTLNGQVHEELTTYYSSTYGDLYPGLYGFYVDPSDGKTYYTTKCPYELVTLSLTGDGKADLTHTGTTSNGIEYAYFAIRYFSSVKNSRIYFSSNVSITIPGMTLTKN